MEIKGRLKVAQENANRLFKMNKGTNPEKANYYLGIWEALVWVQYDVEHDLFEEVKCE